MEKEDNFYQQVKKSSIHVICLSEKKKSIIVTKVKGLIEEESEKKIVEDGNVVIWTTDTARYRQVSSGKQIGKCVHQVVPIRASFPLTEARHGWQPFRLSEAVRGECCLLCGITLFKSFKNISDNLPHLQRLGGVQGSPLEGRPRSGRPEAHGHGRQGQASQELHQAKVLTDFHCELIQFRGLIFFASSRVRGFHSTPSHMAPLGGGTLDASLQTGRRGMGVFWL